MQALDKKLFRDFRRLWVQALAIAMVLACGVAILLTSFGMYRALSETRAAYYERNRFADIFVATRRAPLSLLREISAIPGVMLAQPRVTGDVVLDLPHRIKSAVGRLLSVPETGEPLLNVPLLVAGRWPDPLSVNEVTVNAPFAEANGFRPGDQFHANLNGQKRVLTITGTALSPEFIYTLGPGAIMPDNAGFGILWMPQRAVAAAFDMTGAFNDLSLKLEPRAQAEAVIDALDTLLGPYGGLGAYDRAQQQSEAFVDAEIRQLRGMARILPPIFFAISAFLVSMVMGRIVTLERSEIGLLKAIGYSDLEVCLHYLMLAALVAVAGIAIGWAAGTLLARAIAFQYAEFFDFPFIIFRVSPWVYASSGLAALASTTLGAVRAALLAARLAPAIAMQPPAPPRFRRSILDDLMRAAHLSQPTIMILRSFLRWPVRSALTTLGLGFAVASVVAALFLNDALDTIVDQVFYQTNRQDAMLLFAPDVSESALLSIRRLPGVLQAESQQAHAAVLRHGPYSKRVPVEARKPDPDLSRIVAANGQQINVPPGGIVLARRLAEQLHVQPGQDIEVEFLSGKRETFSMTVSALIDQYFGMGAYVDLDHLNRMFRQAPQVTVINLSLDDSQTENLHRELKTIPKLSGVIMLNDERRSFQNTIRQNVVVMNGVYITIAVLITIGVAYNGARIQLSERTRELASLRILGFSRGAVSYILMGETLILAIAAQPIGWALGAWISWAMTRGFSSDLYSVPLVLKPAGFALASLVVLTASVVSVLVVRRRLDRLNLVASMKTRE